jgi:potassium efflux system protein
MGAMPQNWRAGGVRPGRRLDGAALGVGALLRGVGAGLVLAGGLLLSSLAAQDVAPEPATPVHELPAQNAAVEALLAPVEAENARLSGLLTGPEGLDGEVGRLEDRLAQVEQRLADLHSDRERIEARVRAAGKTQSVGVVLWRAQSRIQTDFDQEQHELDALERRASELQLQLVEFSDLRQELDDLEVAVQRVASDWPAGTSSEDVAAASSAVRSLLVERRQLLESLVASAGVTADALLELEHRQLDLVNASEAFRAYLEEHAVWLRSATPLGEYHPREFVVDVGQALIWILSPGRWGSLLATLGEDARRHWVLAASCLLPIGLLLAARRRLVRRLERLADEVGRPETDTFERSLAATVCTLALCAPWPLLAWLVSWRLAGTPQAGEFERAVSMGLAFVARQSLILMFIREACRPAGLGDAHFGWSPALRQDLRRAARRLLTLWLPCVFVVATLALSGQHTWSESLGRVLFTVSCIVLAAVLARLLRIGGAAWSALEARGRTGWLWTFRHALRWTIILLPVALAVLSLTGFYYTAMTVLRRLLATLGLAAVLAVLHALLLRWLRLVRRRLLTDKRNLRRQAALAAGEERQAAALAEAAAVDVKEVNEQTRSLLRTAVVLALLVGGWMIWVDVFPALSMLDEVTLWHHRVNETRPMLGDDGRPQLDLSGQSVVGNVSVERPVSLMDLLTALLVGVVVLVSARNVRGLLEVSVLRWLPISAPARYAASTLASYLMLLAGIVGVFGALGVAWSDVQWLAAAATVGLGFGLQEIVANFVAGVILLLERPIRVGDMVTVGGVSGTVSRIRMRATTITDWDRRELLVPNKEFITGQVVNWTLSDTVLRVVVKVGVAYGSDTGRVCAILLQIGRENPLVLQQPEPQVCFDSFGDSTLNFELRVFVDAPSSLAEVRHALNLAIDRAFREAAIEIAFPQRDIHVRSLPAGWSAPGSG